MLPVWVAVLALNSAVLIAWTCFWLGTRDLRGTRVTPAALALPPAIWLAAALVPGFMASVPPRIVLFTAMVVPLTAASAWDLWQFQRRTSRSRSARLLMWATEAYGAVLLVRPLPMALGFGAAVDALAILLSSVLFISVGLASVMIASEQEAARDAAALAAAETREHRLRAELAEREADTLRTVRSESDRLVGSIPAGVFLRHIEPDGTHRTIYAGGEIELVTGWPRSVIADPALLNALQESGAPPRAALMLGALRDGAAAQDWRIRQPDGTWRWMRTQVRRLSLDADGGGDVVGYVVDISRERAAEAQSLASARLASLGEMATGLAHELRQPLTIISMAAENASRYLEAGNAAGLRKRLDTIVGQTERANRTIEHLRWFAQGTSHNAATMPLRLDTAVDGALILIGSALHEAGATLIRDLGDPPPTVMADPVGLQQVLVILLQNARDALAVLPAGAAREIRIAVAQKPPGVGTVYVQVADTGGGIPNDHLAHVFEPFFTTKGPDRGTGLGLSIGHGLMRGMGGGIAAANDARGAVFTLTLRPATDRAERSAMLLPDFAK